MMEEPRPLKKWCVIFKRGDVVAAARIAAPDGETARRVFFSNKLGYAGCSTGVLEVGEYDPRLHDGLIEAGQKLRRVG